MSPTCFIGLFYRPSGPQGFGGLETLEQVGELGQAPDSTGAKATDQCSAILCTILHLPWVLSNRLTFNLNAKVQMYRYKGREREREREEEGERERATERTKNDNIDGYMAR